MNIDINMLQFSVLLLCWLSSSAAVIDLTITISSPMYELNETNPNLSQKNYFNLVRVWAEKFLLLPLIQFI